MKVCHAKTWAPNSGDRFAAVNTISVSVSEMRPEAGFSQERFRAGCGVERTYIHKVERGVLNPTAIRRLWIIADAHRAPLRAMARRKGIWVAKRQQPD
jgi:hypothetical protein